MTGWTILARSLRYYRRTHVGVVLGAAVATAVLAGAMLVGDSVRGSLRSLATARLGDTQLALAPGGRFFRDALADDLAGPLGVEAAPVLELRGTAEAGDKFVPGVRVLGVDDRFWKIGGGDFRLALDGEALALNGPLAERLGVKAGGRVIVSMERPSPLSRDAPLATDEPDVAREAMTVAAVLDAGQFGRFDLRANQVAPLNVYVPLGRLQKLAGLGGRANMILVGGAGRRAVTAAEADAALKGRWTLADAEIELRTLPAGGPPRSLEMRSGRVFIDPAIASAAAKADIPALGILTYLANEIRSGDASAPYSMVCALGPLRPPAAGQAPPDDPAWAVIPAGMADDEVVVSSYLAERDLGAAPGAIRRIEMSYFVPTAAGGLEVASSGPLTVRRERPMDEPGMPPGLLMRELMPKIPALPENPTLADLKLGSRIDKKLIERNRRRLDDYWFTFHGTPKAFLTLREGRKLWGGRFGDLTAIRFPPGSAPAVTEAVRRYVDPRQVGLFFVPVRQEALAASAGSTDFGQLFVGLSFFLAAAAVLLLALLFVFGVEQRSPQAGLLLALGYTRRRLRRLLLAEGAVLAVIGGALGLAAGVAYTLAMLAGLATVWRGAAAGAAVEFHAGATTLVLGPVAGVAVAIAAMWIALLRQLRRPARELLARAPADVRAGAGHMRRRAGLGLAALAAGGAAALLWGSRGSAGEAMAGAFFGAGALLLTALLACVYALLARGGRAETNLTLARLGLRNASRRRWRSLAVVGLLACGSFVLVAVGAFRQDPPAGASGTGGFALYGESPVGIVQDLNTPAGRAALSLGEADLAGARFVPLRVHDGDDASCLNLNRPRRPRLLGVNPKLLARRGAFAFAAPLAHASPSPWLLLNAPQGDGAVPAVADRTTLEWSLHAALGDTLEYIDEKGRAFKVRLVGALENSILQGSVMIAEDRFVEHFPGEAGCRLLLIDAPRGQAPAVRDALLSPTSAFRRTGLELVPAVERLAAFSAVQNTYISIFQLLGGLGLVLGSAGLGVVVMRNVAERRGELALLKAVGFSDRSLLALLLREHWLLLAAGLFCGLAAGLAAVLPALVSSRGGTLPLSLPLTLVGVLAAGAAWVYLAARFALRGSLIEALRSE